MAETRRASRAKQRGWACLPCSRCPSSPEVLAVGEEEEDHLHLHAGEMRLDHANQDPPFLRPTLPGLSGRVVDVVCVKSEKSDVYVLVGTLLLYSTLRPLVHRLFPRAHCTLYGAGHACATRKPYDILTPAPRRGADTAHTQMGRGRVHTRHLLESTHTSTNKHKQTARPDKVQCGFTPWRRPRPLTRTPRRVPLQH